VVRERGELATRLEREGLVIVEAPDADRGMSRSLAAGLAAVEAHFPAGPAAAIVALADQPDTPIEVLARLAAIWQTHGDAVVRPRYRATPDEPGHPVLLDRATWGLAGPRGRHRPRARAPRRAGARHLHRRAGPQRRHRHAGRPRRPAHHQEID